jgi:uncharacterized membrane protein
MLFAEADMKRHRRLLFCFFITSLLAGFAFCWLAGRGVYGDYGGQRGRELLFDMTPVVRVASSAVVGVFLGGVITATMYAAGKVCPPWRR